MITFENEDSHYEQFVSANEDFVLIESPFLGKGQWMLVNGHLKVPTGGQVKVSTP